MKIDKAELAKNAEKMTENIQAKQNLMKEIDNFNLNAGKEKKRIKYNPNNVLMIEKINEKIIFLERGDSAGKSGYKHVLKHADDFKKGQGIMVSKIPQTLFNTLRKNEIRRYQGKGTGRPVYNGEQGAIAITVADNGYIVGANPTK
ncbi:MULTISPECIES: hypothetical protein [unclassified Legionella]|uniref:hypothetical protein n=1 Tax=unclassified Legionella TaxID=2622702 RepID=UPI00105569ED|nr:MULTISPECIES: hypothetical protein [unclassified Legionella]MDI9818799.1 hypothetical protein [Legionella sp. PL877]